MNRYLRYLSDEASLAVVLPFIVVAVLLTLFFSGKTPAFRTQRNKFLLYLLGMGLLLVAFEIILYHLKNTSVNIRFIANQVFVLLLGILHVTCFNKLFDRFEIKKTYQEILFVVITALYLMVFLALSVGYYENFEYIYYFLSVSLVFVAPTFVLLLFEKAVTIPVRLYKRWFYPLKGQYPSPKATEMRNIVLLSLIFQKKESSKDIINFKVKAPRAMDFGRLFYYFINDYNEKHPNGKIHYSDENKEPYGWYFYSKPKWFNAARHIDPDETVDSNNLKDSTTIICQRI